MFVGEKVFEGWMRVGVYSVMVLFVCRIGYVFYVTLASLSGLFVLLF